MKEPELPTPLVKTAQVCSEHFIVRVGEGRSEQRVAREGLPRGWPLFPVLFKVYVKDITQFPGLPGLNTFQFTDDTAILVIGYSEENC
ncbi:hypothetical protein Trydic_g23495 [Trypoxylus dichotomus]